jgi:hypothetical protein
LNSNCSQVPNFKNQSSLPKTPNIYLKFEELNKALFDFNLVIDAYLGHEGWSSCEFKHIRK